jgi:amidase
VFQNRGLNCSFRVAAILTAVLAASLSVGAQQAAPTRFHLQDASVADIQRAIIAKQITSVALVELYLKRIKVYNNTCVSEPMGILGPITTIPHARHINALSTLNLRPSSLKAWGFDERKARSMTDAIDNDPNMPDALEVAASQDRHFKQTGRLVGPLHGVVMAIKDQYDTFDLRTTSGADAQYANDRPPADATFVKRLRDAGAIILAKANLAEYATDGARSSFGGTFCNPYDTEREPGMSSAGSATSVAANLVTCAIGEETVVSIRWPASVNSLVGLAPSQNLVSRKGMIGAGLNMRTGPICRNVQDAAKILDVIAGYDPKDETTVFTIGRRPPQRYVSFATSQRLDGVRIGVIREYMARKLFSQADQESIDIVEHAIDDLRKLGATIVDPGPEGALFQSCISRYAPELLNSAFTRQYRELFPIDAGGQPQSDQIATLLDMHTDTARVPQTISLRSLNGLGVPGEDKYEINKYLQERGDANIKTNADLIAKAKFYDDPNFPNRKQGRQAAERATMLDTSGRVQTRVALQTLFLQCMEEQHLDALVSPMSTVPPRKLTAPREPNTNGRSPIGWSLIGQQGFPAITVPAGFATQIWDRVPDASGDTRLIGPVAANLPVGVDFIARPFNEAMLFRIASAFEAATRHRKPPREFGPLPGEP